jgi:hypothetical protein
MSFLIEIERLIYFLLKGPALALSKNKDKNQASRLKIASLIVEQIN